MSGTRVMWSMAVALAVGVSACGPASPGGRATSPTSRPTSTAAGPTASSPTSGAATAPPTTASPSATPAPPTATVPPTTRRPTPTPTTQDRCRLTAKYLGEDLEVLPTSRRIVALTFDAGASSSGVSSILATLAREKVPATFFLTGDFAREHPASARAISAAHPAGNHTENHPDLTALSSLAVVDEIRHGAATIRAVTGRAPGPWFRFPYGETDARTIRLVNEECYVAVRWTVDSLGWKGTSGGMTTTSVRDRVLAAARPGMIVLMHVGANPDDETTLDAAALPGIIDGLRERGYAFVSLPLAL